MPSTVSRTGAVDPTAAPQASSPVPTRAHLRGLGSRGGELGFGRSLGASVAIHATALGASLLIAFGAEPGLRGSAPEAALVFAEAQPDTTWRLEQPELEPNEVESPDEPPAELRPVPEELPDDPFQPDPALAELPDDRVTWTRVGPEPLEDLRERVAEQRRQQALAEALAAAQPAAPAASAPATPRGEDRPLKLVHAPRPEYPRISLRLAEQGAVLVRIHVGPDGHVTDVDLLESSGFERLDTAALAAVRLWRFDPRLAAGQAVAGTFDHRVVFVLEQVGYQ